jgi:hypothetical protein
VRDGVYYYYTYRILPTLDTPPREAHTHIENSVHETEKVFGPFRGLSSCRLKVAVVSSFRGTSRQ